MDRHALLCTADGRVLDAKATNISSGGLGLVCAEHFKPNATVTVRLPLPWQDTVATAAIRCRVAFTHYVGPEQAFRLGLQFREFLGESEAMVRDYIQRRENGGKVSFVTV